MGIGEEGSSRAEWEKAVEEHMSRKKGGGMERE